MMKKELPYLSIDDDFFFNYSLLVLILHRLGHSPKNNAVLDFEKLQIFLYLTKNPSKINSVLKMAGKKDAPLGSQYTFTIESLSTNVDILFNRDKLKFLLKELAAHGMLACEKKTDQDSIKYILNKKGEDFADYLVTKSSVSPSGEALQSTSFTYESGYFLTALEIINSLSAIQSQSVSKLNAYLNKIFKRNVM